MENTKVNEEVMPPKNDINNTDEGTEKESFKEKLYKIMTVDSDIENIASIFHILMKESGKI